MLSHSRVSSKRTSLWSGRTEIRPTASLFFDSSSDWMLESEDASVKGKSVRKSAMELGCKWGTENG